MDLTADGFVSLNAPVGKTLLLPLFQRTCRIYEFRENVNMTPASLCGSIEFSCLHKGEEIVDLYQ